MSYMQRLGPIMISACLSQARSWKFRDVAEELDEAELDDTELEDKTTASGWVAGSKERTEVVNRTEVEDKKITSGQGI